MIPFGPGPLPTDSAELVERLTRQLADRLRMRPEQVVVDGELATPAAVERLHLDLSGQSVDVDLDGFDPRKTLGAPDHLTDESPTHVRTASMTGEPVRVMGAPVSVRVDATQVPATWQRGDDGALWLTPRDEASPEGPMTARVVARGDVQAATRAAVTAAQEVARQRGVTLRELQITPTTLGRNHIRVDVLATVAKSILSSKVTARVEVQVDEALVVHVRTLDASVGGFLKSIAQPVIDRKLAPWRGRSVPLAEGTFAGARLRSFDLVVDPKGEFLVSAST